MLENWYWIMPNKILFNKILSDKQKLLYCYISSLCAEKWYCWASNEYIWQQIWTQKDNISKNINQLIKLWFLYVEIQENYKRKITMGIVKNHQGDSEKSLGGDSEKSLYNNIKKNNINNIINNNQKSEDFWDFNFSQDFKDVFFLYEKHRKEKKSKLTETARNQLLKKSSAVGEKIAIEKIQESIQNWRTWVFFDKEQKQKNKPKLACEDKTKDFNFLD